MTTFDNCKHEWEFHTNSRDNGAHSGFEKPWKSIYACKNCNNIITLEEKCALDNIVLQGESNRKQEKSLQIAMWAMVIGAMATLISSFLN